MSTPLQATKVEVETDALNAVLRLRGLTKRYGRRVAVDDLTFDVPRGVTAGFVGPNGAGKTTTLAMLLGLIRPTSGDADILGSPLTAPGAYLPRVGALIESPAFYRGLSGRENLAVLATVADHDRAAIPTLLEQVGLKGREDDPFRTYSMGMKQRLGIAASLLGDPELLLLDEPTNGLDPQGIHEMRELIRSLGRERRTVLVSSHFLGELEQMCDWLIVINHGRLVFAGPAAAFLAKSASSLAVVPEREEQLDELLDLLRHKNFRARREDQGVVLTLDGNDARQVGAAVNRAASASGIVLAELTPVRPHLEERYLATIAGASDE